MLQLLLLLFHMSYKKLITIKIHSLSRPNYNLIRLLDKEIDSASFAPLNLKLLFRNSLFDLGSVSSVRTVAVLRKWLSGRCGDIPSQKRVP